MANQEAYYDMLVKYRDELARPMQEAMDFMRRIETQLNMLSNGPVRIFSSGIPLSIFISIYTLPILTYAYFYFIYFYFYLISLGS
jgi:hypothetical protein